MTHVMQNGNSMCFVILYDVRDFHVVLLEAKCSTYPGTIKWNSKFGSGFKLSLYLLHKQLKHVQPVSPEILR